MDQKLTILDITLSTSQNDIVVVKRNFLEKKHHMIFMRKTTTSYFTAKCTPKAMSTGTAAGSLGIEQGI